MRFWTVEAPNGETIGCELTKRKAVAIGIAAGHDPAELSISWDEIEVTAESIRLILANRGGYAKACGNV